MDSLVCDCGGGFADLFVLVSVYEVEDYATQRRDRSQCTGSRGTGRRGTGSFSKWRACARQEESTLAAETDSQNI